MVDVPGVRMAAEGIFAEKHKRFPRPVRGMSYGIRWSMR